MGDRSHLGAFHIRFTIDKELTVNGFRQRINQLFQGFWVSADFFMLCHYVA
jgi:hypothetical protein